VPPPPPVTEGGQGDSMPTPGVDENPQQ